MMKDLDNLKTIPNTAILGDDINASRIVEKLKEVFLTNGVTITSLTVASKNVDDNLFFSNPIKRIFSQLKASVETNTQSAIFIKLEHEFNDDIIKEITTDICKLLEASEYLNAKVVVSFKETFELDEELSKRFELICFSSEQE